MGILVWGFGNYYKQKGQIFSRDMITAFVSGKETGKYDGIDIISPKQIPQYNFDKLYIMTSLGVAFEILEELRRLNYQEWDKVAFGWNMEPYTEEEAFLFEDGEIKCNSEGVCEYISQNQIMKIENEMDWKKLRQWKVRNLRNNEVSGVQLKPISEIFGFDRGQPIDRYYIEKFLGENAKYIRGTVLEVAEREYTVKYGTDVEKSICMHVCDSVDNNCIIVNLETGEGVIDDLADCFILTQTLPVIFDVQAAAENAIRLLKSGGVALVTVSGITQISRYDMDRWGHFWSFTTASLKKLFESCEDVEYVEVKAYGNVKTSISALYGLAVEDMKQEDFAYQDDDYQQIITAMVRKKKKEESI